MKILYLFKHIPDKYKAVITNWAHYFLFSHMATLYCPV